MIDTALAFLSPADRVDEDALREAGVASGLVELNPGPTAHSISLTAAGHDACHAAGGEGAPQNGGSAGKRQVQERKKPARR